MSFPGTGRAPWRSHPAMKGMDMTEVIRNIHTDFSLLEDVIQILPEQGCIEVQHDGPGKVHDWHQHANEETLIILKGKMTFALESGVHVCGPGDMLHLCANDRHRSVAGPQGAVYLIAFRRLDIR
ncbi:cupin domain-containing protein [Verminephrobacter eiseniae]|nr:cupin domain-containing protein [Verminephrobacter eiseniae]MCW5287010.1 cupin domain-containing protein [Verminephrobacter eiseniae]MCW5305308.1 cupin domain-containing protein [Verminephrobacter eiseniae]MCW8180746.1 cupin domain-containing protein [Verminephrobacter eiseniae]MCW8189737.1 cupin domain-containing protein [Verminephrobacter eiseniae]